MKPVCGRVCAAPVVARRHGIALPASLAGILIAAGLAALAHQRALHSLREAAAVTRGAQETASRMTLRTRMAVQLRVVPVGELTRGERPLGGGDTVLRVSEIRWPWHRVAALVGGVEVLGEVALARPPVLPWCATAVASGEVIADEGAVAAEWGSGCADLARVPPSEVKEFDSVLVARSIGLDAATTLVVAGADPAPRVWRAHGSIRLTAGASVTGLVVAPVVHLGPGARVRGGVVAGDSLVVALGAQIAGDRFATAAAVAASAALNLTGRRGLLLPP